VTEDMAEPENAGLLRALGEVEPPDPGTLAAAREVLWSAVTGEMLSTGPEGDTGRAGAAGTDRPGEDVRRRRTEPG
jgi:hypothetical protein